MRWTFIKEAGLSSDNSGVDLLFGSYRQGLRQRLMYDPGKNKGRSASEDNYKGASGNSWFRLTFEGDKLAEIEILVGVISVSGIEVQTGSDLQSTLRQLTESGFVFGKGPYSHTDFSNFIDIGDSEENGAGPNKVIWFYTAQNFDHFKD